MSGNVVSIELARWCRVERLSGREHPRTLLYRALRLALGHQMQACLRAAELRLESELQRAAEKLRQLNIEKWGNPCGPKLRGGGLVVVEAAEAQQQGGALAAPDAQQHGDRDEDDQIEELQERLREDGARPPKAEYVKAALVLARDHDESYNPDQKWFAALGVKPGGAQTRIKKWAQRIRAKDMLTPLAPEPPSPPSDPRTPWWDRTDSLPPPLIVGGPIPCVDRELLSIGENLQRWLVQLPRHRGRHREGEEFLQRLGRKSVGGGHGTPRWDRTGDH